MIRPAITSLHVGDELRAPAVGVWSDIPVTGARILPGRALGRLEILGVVHDLIAPAGAGGVVTVAPRGVAHVAVGYDERLVVLGMDAGAAAATDAAEADAAAGDPAATDAAQGGLVVRAPTSGRFYRRPAPDAQPFVSVGDEIEFGHTVCLLEVMKTFNRVVYGGEGLPPRARVVAIVPDDDSDLNAGDVIVRLAAVSGG